MSATEAYMAALDAGDDRALEEAEEKLRREQGGVALVAVLEAWLAKEAGDERETAAVQRRLADALEDVAKSRTADDAATAAARAAVLRAELDDEEGADRATALALALSIADEGALERYVRALGGRGLVVERVSRRLKQRDLKQDAGATAALRRVLARLAELDGDKERAFLEMLRAVRKAPEEPLYVDEVFRLCLAAEKHQELCAVLVELAEQGSLPERHRATLWNKVGHLRERELDDEKGALAAYRRSLALFPESKGARRHVERLARALGEVPEEAEQEIDDADVMESVADEAPVASLNDGPPPLPPEDGDDPLAEAPVDDPHPPLLDDEDVAVTAESSRVASAVTFGTMDPTQQDVSLPPADERPTTEAPVRPTPATVVEGESDEPDEGPRHPSVLADGADDAVTDQSVPEAPTVLEAPKPKERRRKRKRKRKGKRDSASGEAKPAPPSLYVEEEDDPAPVDELVPTPSQEGPIVPAAAEADPATTTPAGLELAPPTLGDAGEAALDEPDPTDQGAGRRDVFAEADSLLEGDDALTCVEIARELLEHPQKGSLVLRLVARALELAATQNAEPHEEAVDLFVEEAPGNASLAVSLARSLFERFDDEGRRRVLPVWVAAARAAGEDVESARAFLEPFAAVDAPHGMAFRQLDQTLAQGHDLDGRDALWASAFAALPAADEQRRRAVLVGHIRLLGDAERHEQTLPLYETLVLEVAPADEVLRERALAAFERHGERAAKDRFLDRLAKAVKGPQAIVLLRRLLVERRGDGDEAGAEAAARALLDVNPGDPEAVDALCELLAPHVDRAQERTELLRLRFDLARKRRDKRALPRAARELAEQLTTLARRADALDALRTALLELPDDDALLGDVSERLVSDGRDADLVKLLQELVDKTQEPTRKVALLLKGAEVSRVRLKKLSRAQELVERALELSPDSVSALLARADIAQDLGDAGGALAPLERLAARLDDPAERARVHYRIGRLLEEHLLRPDDARRRYRAAVEGNPSRRDAWEALLALAEKSKQREDQVDALAGLAALVDGEERAALCKRIARVERDERVDVEAAERALRQALEAAPGDEEALEELMRLVVARLTGEHDLDAALASPAGDVLGELADALAGVVSAARRERRGIAPRVRRLHALALGRRGEIEQARAELDALLKDAPTDLETLLSYARLLEELGRTDDDASDERRRLLETALLHHAPDLDEEQQVRLWGEVGALRWYADEREAARKALHKAVTLARETGHDDALGEVALEAAVSALRGEQGRERDVRTLVFAQRKLATRWRGAEGVELLLEAARSARDELADPALARAVLEEAIALDPDARAPRKALLDLDVQEGNADAAMRTTRELLERERDAKRRAALHAQLAELYKSAGRDDDASAELKRALQLDPQSRAILELAEAFFAERKDASALASLYAAQLKALSKDDAGGRVALLERLAQVRRYDLGDLAGAVEALEAITALEPEAIKPREDAARLYTQLGHWREAAGAWRGVLERDPLAVEAWRSLFALYARTKQADEAFSVAASMVAVEIADDDMSRAVRAVRPPFPRWPRAPKDPTRIKRRLGHPLEATPIRVVLDMVGHAVHRHFAPPLKEFGLSKRERLVERQVPPSVMLAIRTARELVGLSEVPPLYRAQLGAVSGQTPPFALLPATEPGLVVSDEALSGGMTPERAFALGRAMAWLMPHAVLAGTLPPATLKEILEALVVRFIPGADVEGDVGKLEHLGHQLETEVFRGRPGPNAETLRRGLLAALRDYVHARDQVHLADWMAGVNYTADRLGFLLAGDLTPSVRVIKAAAGQQQKLGARLAIKELVLFSVSAPYLTLRRELGLALPDAAAKAVLEL